MLSRFRKKPPFALLCPSCRTPLKGWPPLPQCRECKTEVEKKREIYLFHPGPDDEQLAPPPDTNYDPIARAFSRYLYPPSLADQFFPGYAAAIHGIIGKHKYILNLGCGPGFHAMALARLGHRVMAADESLVMMKTLGSQIAKSSNKLRPVALRVKGHDLPVADHSVDAVVVFSFLGFRSRPVSIVDEIKRVLHPNGVLITNARCDRPAPKGEMMSWIRGRYTELARKMTQQRPRLAGWTRRQINENLSKHFHQRIVVENRHLVFEFQANPLWSLEQFRNRLAAFQTEEELATHRAIMDRIDEELKSRYGKVAPTQELPNTWTDRLSVYTDWTEWPHFHG